MTGPRWIPPSCPKRKRREATQTKENKDGKERFAPSTEEVTEERGGCLGVDF